MVKREAVIQNEAGIHCRPSAILVETRNAYSGEVTVRSEQGVITLKSALECIMLGLEKGAHVTIEVEGPDEAQFAEELVTLFERQFDFSA
jgi:phosphocarrier protein HPr